MERTSVAQSAAERKEYRKGRLASPHAVVGCKDQKLGLADRVLSCEIGQANLILRCLASA